MQTKIVVTFLMISVTAYSQNNPFLNAQWISNSSAKDSRVCPVFRKEFNTNSSIKQAWLSITAHGLYEASINGKKISDEYFEPGFTSYSKRLQYQQYNVTRLLGGKNETTVTIGDGWWRGVFGGDMQANRYGSDASLLCLLEIEYTDGHKEIVETDSSWQCSTGPVRYADIYGGSVIDTRITNTGWEKVSVENFTKDNLVTSISEPIIKQESFKPKSVNGRVIDFGQNMAGWVQIKIKGKAGDTIRIYHAETLDKNGNFFTGNLREAKATDVYVLNGRQQVLEPMFTYHGFRYAKAEGFVPTKENCIAVAVHSNLKHTGNFVCSNSLINQLQHNIEWSLNSNFFDIPTDCPQRSERLGWTGDAQMICATAAFNRDVKNFFTKWLADLKANQGVNGGVPAIIPDIYHYKDSLKRGVAGWSDAATIIPWTLFEIYNDTDILQTQYSSMKAWVNYIEHNSTDYLWEADGYGDWYAPDETNTPVEYIDECFFAYSTSLLIKAATVLAKKDDIEKYSTLLQLIKEAFNKRYPIVPQTQTAYVLGLLFGLLPDSSVERLVSLIHKNNDHLSTGFLGTPYILPVLSRYGYTELAYTLINQKTIPSWLYPVTKGATTIWEKWDAIKPDGSFDTCSLNHYAYGAVGDWLYKTVAGIDAMEPGYKKIKIAPHPGGGLKWVKASYECSYGKIVSNWKLKGNKIKMHVEIPKGSSAMVYVPGKDNITVSAGKYDFVGLKQANGRGTN